MNERGRMEHMFKYFPEAAIGFANYFARMAVREIRKELGLDTPSQQERPASTPAEVPGS